MKKLARSIAVASMVTSPLAYSAGFQLNEHSISGLGRAYAGEAAAADNAAVLARNPAAMAVFKKQQVSITGHYIVPDINVEGTNTVINPLVPANGTEFDASADDVAPNAFVPGLYYVLPINDEWHFGVAANSYFGLSSDYPDSYGGGEFAGHTSVETIYISPSVSYTFNNVFSLGLSVSYIYGKGEIENKASQAFNAANPGAPVGTTLLDVSGSGSGFGWSVGGLWQIDESSRLGLSYRGATDLTVDADVDAVARNVKNGKGEITFNLPGIAEIGYFNQINDNWSVAAGVQWIQWSRFEDLTVDIETGSVGEYTFKEENWKDTWRYSAGADYSFNEMVTIRAGYAYDESPVRPDYRTLTIPDAARNWVSVGMTLDFQETGSLDLGFSYLFGASKPRITEETSTVHPQAGEIGLTEFNGQLTSVSAFIFGAGYNIKF
ncbi:Long-chain fatty acid transport protein [BD1-7 clade bacterium]|uniref:Long-chain fatty acid transport protein n=1 Tax=BD1-7 clade bacterium TaxID=2029982 RepID=A0A5S9QUI7_9GAMM|nr:Long-chain fatty acid transport protein [BD1-7 clade bacterium]CAA0122633.1 Long-chain fatty acid transport protein [BD1-7 clade bacterium]